MSTKRIKSPILLYHLFEFHRLTISLPFHHELIYIRATVGLTLVLKKVSHALYLRYLDTCIIKQDKGHTVTFQVKFKVNAYDFYFIL